ncbi:MAG: DUF5666 domain-containing protein, partial [Gammaproteobacteria bacterium]|nr:DUF5666 domain-containing protein [Gammaproteobacteria bacterium]
LTFVTNAETRYEINGAAFVGSAGLAEIALHENIPVVAGVSINAERQPVAFTVLAGSSVPWTDGDVVHGVVAARSVDTLTIKGARVEFTDGTDVFRGEYEVLLGAGTEVLSILVSSDLLDNDSISVGQRVTVWGEILDDGTVDAAEGRIRMQVSSFTAEVTQASPLTADLFSLNGRDPGAYDFSGTGSTAADDADSGEYQVDTASLGLETIEIGDLVRVAGNVNAWGMAPDDFNAVTVIDIDTDMRGAHLFASWIEIGGSSTAFTSVDPGGIEVDLTAARRSLKLRGVPAEAVNLGDAIRLVAPADGGVWAVAVRDAGALQMYRDFAELADEIVSQLAAGNLLVRISASGRYNGADSELTSGRAIFVFVEPDSL